MTVDTTIRKKIYLGNSNQTEFAIPFVYIKDSDIRAVRTRVDGTDAQILDNFSISRPSGGWAVFTYPLTGAPLEFGESLTIYRVTDTRQLTDLLNGGDFNADVIELALDQITMMVQDLTEQMGRVPVIPITESADFEQMIRNVLTAEAKIEADRKFIEEMAGTFESATEIQRGVGYVASDEEAESFTTGARDPAGPAFLDPERGEKLARAVVAEYGLDFAAIDRLGTVRIAKQSEVTNGVTEAGRSPAVIRPEELAGLRANLSEALAGESNKFIPADILKKYIKTGTGYLQIGMTLICFGRSGASYAAFAKAFATPPQVMMVSRLGVARRTSSSMGEATTYTHAYTGSVLYSFGPVFSNYDTYRVPTVRAVNALTSVAGITVPLSGVPDVAVGTPTETIYYDYIVIGQALEA